MTILLSLTVTGGRYKETCSYGFTTSHVRSSSVQLGAPRTTNLQLNYVILMYYAQHNRCSTVTDGLAYHRLKTRGVVHYNTTRGLCVTQKTDER